MSEIDEIRNAIRRMHLVEATHVKSVPVKEIFQGEIVWDGAVEIFDLKGHVAKQLYAWADRLENGKIRFVTVLQLDPIDSSQAAVRAAIVRDRGLIQEG